MSEDLLSRIQREMNERLRELRGAVEEHDRLMTDLQGLRAMPDPAAVPEPVTSPSSTVRRPLPCTGRAVSPKIARLMRSSCARPSLGRPGVPRVGAAAHAVLEDDLAAGSDLFPGVDPVLGLDEVDVEAEVYERSL